MYPISACIGVDVGQNITEYVIVQVGCPGKTIIDFVSSTPIGMTKSGIQNPSTGLFIASTTQTHNSICHF